MFKTGQFFSRTKTESEVAGHYIHQQELSILNTFKQAWQLSKGARLTLVTAFIMISIISLVFSGIVNVFFSESYLTKSLPYLKLLLQCLFQLFVAYPLSMGLKMLAIHRARGKVITVKKIFDYFQKRNFIEIVKMILWILIISLAGVVVFSLIIYLAYIISPDFILHKVNLTILLFPIMLFFSYLWLSYQFSLQIIADKVVKAGFALMISRKGFNQHFIKIIPIHLISISIIILFALLVLYLFSQVSSIFLTGVSICLAIFLLLPWLSIVNGIIYNHIFPLSETSE
ncbi:MAG: hypothetical protein LEGION0398_MBIBDBAK_00931 [Legionellaceae bacterium]